MLKTYLVIFATLAIAMLYLTLYSFKTGSKHKATVSEGYSIGAGDEADERYRYELMMLRDPSTGKIPANIRMQELAFTRTLPNDGFLKDAFAHKTTSTSMVWQSRGPWNVGGRTRALAIDVSNENNLIAGTCSGGMYRSVDGGAHWNATTPIDSYQSVACITQDKREGHTNVWYYGTGEAYGASASATGAYYLGNGIFKSVDSGKTWHVIPSTASSSVVSFLSWSQVAWNIATDPSDTINDVIYEAAYGGINRSINGGVTWNIAVGSFTTSTVSYFTDVAVTSTGVVYATLSSDGPDKGIYRSPDGVTFTNITPAGFAATYDRIKIGISPADENQVYFLANTPNAGIPDTNFMGQVEWNSLWKYNYVSGTGADSGGLWRDFSNNLPNTGGIFDKYQCQGSYDMVIKPKPNDTNIVFIGGTNLYRSTSGFADAIHTTYIGGYEQGASLPVVVSYASHHPDQHELVFFPGNPDIMYSSNDGGIFRTLDNTANTVVWNSLNNGYITTMFYTCAVDHALENDIIIGGAQDNGSWYTNSPSLLVPWVSPNGGDGSFCSVADSGKAYYFSIQSGKMRKTKLNSSGGVDSFARIDPIGGKDYLFINPYILDPNNNDLMYLAGGKYLWRNNNLAGIPYAGNWDSISTNWYQFPDSIIIGGTVITALGVSTYPPNRLYVGTSAQRVYRINNADTATSMGTTITAPIFPYSGNVSCIAVDPRNADSLIVVFSNYGVYSLFFSANGGTSWSKIGGNLESSASGLGGAPSCRWASILHMPDGIVYMVATSVGLFATTALTGTTTVWTHVATNTIGESVVNMIDYRESDGLLVAATHSHGIFSTHITSIVDVLGIQEKYTAQSLSLNLSNYPNPFNAATTIQFNLSERTNVTITISDELGRQLQVLTNGIMDAGEQKVMFYAQNLSPGMYYCTVKTGGFSETRKLYLMR